MKLSTLGFVAATLTAPTFAQAATVDGTYIVTPALSVSAGVPISIWLERILSPGLSTVYALTSPGTMVADADGAMIDGRVANLNNASAGFVFDFDYDRDFSDNADPTPEFKVVFPGVTPHGNEDYIDMEGGTLTGVDGFAGLNMTVSRAPVSGEAVTQIGGGITSDIGANQHNSNYGLSGWFLIESVDVDMAACALCLEDELFYQNLVGTQGGVFRLPGRKGAWCPSLSNWGC